MNLLGLYEADSHMYYVDKEYAVLCNPFNNNKPTIVKRSSGEPDLGRVERILSFLRMKPAGERSWREDGLWNQELQECSGGT